MNKRKFTVGIGLIYAILFSIFNLLVFTIFKTRTNVFWLSYVFMTVAFAVQIGSMFLAVKPGDLEATFLGIPLATFSIYYLCAALVVGTVFMIFQKAGVTLATIIQLLILGFYLIAAIFSLLSRDAVQAVSNHVKDHVIHHQSFLCDIEQLACACAEPQVKAAINKLADTVKYSDPISTAAIAPVEERIMHTFLELRIAVDTRQTDEALHLCNTLELLYLERNQKLALSK
jgi:hypothetical protein